MSYDDNVGENEILRLRYMQYIVECATYPIREGHVQKAKCNLNVAVGPGGPYFLSEMSNKNITPTAEH